MIRQPSSFSQLYAWHRAYMADGFPPYYDEFPECGWFKTKLVRGGPWVPVEIKVEREICPDTGELLGPEKLVAILDGMRRDAERIWMSLKAISREEHDYLNSLRAEIPAMAATMAKVDLSKGAIRP
jgi:hypothetical protein